MNRLVVRQTRPFQGKLVAPPSKYHTHRALVLASLAEGESLITGVSESLDNMSTLRCLELLGTGFERRLEGCRVRGGPYRTPENVLDVGNSGSTIHFLLALASTAPGAVVFTGDASIRSRPQQPYLEALNQWGIEAWSTRGDGRPPIIVKHQDPSRLGPQVEVDGLISPWTTGLLLLAPFIGREVRVGVTGAIQESGYVSMTIGMMRQFGVEVVGSPDHSRYVIPGDQHYRPAAVRIPGDIALASFGLALAALTGSRLSYSNLDVTSAHPEAAIIPALQSMGADLRIERETGTVEITGGKRLRGIEVDGGDSPDLVPILSVLLALAQGKGRIFNAAQLRYKESDRLAAMTQLNKMGARVRETADGLEFEGVAELHGAEVDSFHDHRVQMSLAVAGSVAAGTTLISDPEAAGVSYPGFVSDLISLGVPLEIRQD
ncbi:MAG: 3-phosphoshikimate 1-carboxyvinyltransferase [Thermodesulfobacteriota bacterium]